MGLSGTRVRRSLFESDVDKAGDTEEGWEMAEVRCRPLLPCCDSKFDFDCNKQRMLIIFTVYIIFNIQSILVGDESNGDRIIPNNTTEYANCIRSVYRVWVEL